MDERFGIRQVMQTPAAIHQLCSLDCCCSVAKSRPTLCNPMDCNSPGFSVLHYLPELAQTHVHWVGDAIYHLILWYPLLLLSIFPSITVFSSESTLPIRWPKYWSFNFSISPSNEYSGWISFRIDWFDLLVVSRIFQQALSFTSCVTLGELPYLSRTQFPPLLNRLHVSQNLVVGEG